jgi:hypothetical protein
LTSSSLPSRTAARRCDLRNLRTLLAIREHAHEQALRCGSDGYVTHRSTGDPDLLAFYRFPGAHWSKLRSTNPLERVNREIGRRADVVGIFPNNASAIRLAGALLIEQNDEWLVSRRYLSEESLALVLGDHDVDEEVVSAESVAA